MTFDRIAPYYDRLASLVFGKSIRAAQVCFLSGIPPASYILILGGGTGRIISEIRKQRNNCHIWYIEHSATMLELSRQKNPSDEYLHYIQGTECEIPSHITFDVVITQFYFDLFTVDSLSEALGKIRMALKSNALWLVADFTTPQKWWQHVMLALMYRFFRIVSNIEANKLPRWNEALMAAGFFEFKQKSFFGSFIKSAVYRGVSES